MSRRRFVINIYNGTPYKGWQSDPFIPAVRWRIRSTPMKPIEGSDGKFSPGSVEVRCDLTEDPKQPIEGPIFVKIHLTGLHMRYDLSPVSWHSYVGELKKPQKFVYKGVPLRPDAPFLVDIEHFDDKDFTPYKAPDPAELAALQAQQLAAQDAQLALQQAQQAQQAQQQNGDQTATSQPEAKVPETDNTSASTKNNSSNDELEKRTESESKTQ